MKDIIFTGAAVAIVTPFTEIGINFPELCVGILMEISL